MRDLEEKVIELSADLERMIRIFKPADNPKSLADAIAKSSPRHKQMLELLKAQCDELSKRLELQA